MRAALCCLALMMAATATASAETTSSTYCILLEAAPDGAVYVSDVFTLSRSRRHHVAVYGDAFEQHVRATYRIPAGTKMFNPGCPVGRSDRELDQHANILRHRGNVASGERIRTVVTWSPDAATMEAATLALERETQDRSTWKARDIGGYVYCTHRTEHADHVAVAVSEVIRHPATPRMEPFETFLEKRFLEARGTPAQGRTKAACSRYLDRDQVDRVRARDLLTFRSAPGATTYGPPATRVMQRYKLLDTTWTLDASGYQAYEAVAEYKPRTGTIYVTGSGTGPTKPRETSAGELVSQRAELERREAEEAVAAKRLGTRIDAQRRKAAVMHAEYARRRRACRAGDKPSCGPKPGPSAGATKQ